MIHSKTTKTNIIVSQVQGKHINNSPSKVERIDAINTNVLSSNSEFLREKAIPTIHIINARIAQTITIVDRPNLGVVNK